MSEKIDGLGEWRVYQDAVEAAIRIFHRTTEFACRYGYPDEASGMELDQNYDQIVSQIICIMNETEKWVIRS